tara:strand:- start:1067 stop:1576 length:510 start_codon:yes stop_codon:yes gene_type:complete
MGKRFFAEDVVEETKEAVVEESTPDSHEQFVNLLVDMGLTAEQSEAVHQMALDLIDAGDGAEATEEVVEEVEKVEASRLSRRRRAMARAKANRGGSRGRKNFKSEGREARTLGRLRKQNIELRKQLREFGELPAAKPLRNAPTSETENATKALSGATSRAFDMINNAKK